MLIVSVAFKSVQEKYLIWTWYIFKTINSSITSIWRLEISETTETVDYKSRRVVLGLGFWV